MEYIKILQLLRSLRQRWFYTSINVLGLGIGLGCALLMTIYIVHEYSYDKYHKNADNIYRCIEGHSAKTSFALGEAMEQSVPEIENIFRMKVNEGVKIKKDLSYLDEGNIVFAENAMLDMLDIQMIYGKKKDQLNPGQTIMISEQLANKLFPEKNPLGEQLELAISQQLKKFQVSGVFKDFPSYSSIQTQLISFIDNSDFQSHDLGFSLGFSEKSETSDYRTDWGKCEFATFVQMHRERDVKSVSRKCTEIYNQHVENEKDEEVWFQPLSQIYLQSAGLNGNFSFQSNNLESLKIFMAIGILILVVAIINFILISNADNNVYINEIACRKVNGASKKQITLQQLSRSVFVAMISLLPALFFIWLVIPIFNRLFDKSLAFNLIFQWQYLIILFLVTLFTGLLAGSYLSLIVSRANPLTLFQKRGIFTSRQGRYKGALVVLQFMVFIFLASVFLTMYRQYQYSLHKDIGLNTKNVISFNIGNDGLMSQIDVIQDLVMQNPHVKDCKGSSFSTPPSANLISWGFTDAETGEKKSIKTVSLGKGVIELLGIEVLEGKTYKQAGPETQGLVINESAANAYNCWVGGEFRGAEIIGVVKDFNSYSLRHSIKPTIIWLQNRNLEKLLVKTDGNIQDVVKEVRQICESLVPGYWADYELFDERLARFYKEEEKQMGTIGFFAAIAMGLSVLGLLGFVALNLVKRIKEMGIRKINGAKPGDLISMMNKQYMLWIGIAFILVTPVSHYLMQLWLLKFAYHIALDWWMYASVGLLAVGLAMITVSWQSWRAARRNPIEALRYE